LNLAGYAPKGKQILALTVDIEDFLRQDRKGISLQGIFFPLYSLASSTAA